MSVIFLLDRPVTARGQLGRPLLAGRQLILPGQRIYDRGVSSAREARDAEGSRRLARQAISFLGTVLVNSAVGEDALLLRLELLITEDSVGSKLAKLL